MMVIQKTADCAVMFHMLGKAPKESTGAYVITESTMFEVRSMRHHEAIDEVSGEILGEGMSFMVYAYPGMRVRLRPIEPPRTDFSAAEIDAARQQCTVRVLKQERYDGGDFCFDGNLDDVLASLQAIRASIPEEYRASATCEIGSESGYEGSHYASIEVNYSRPETDDEVRQRLMCAETDAFLRERKERAHLALLQKRYAKANT